jgi:hypothetical protein
MPHVRLAALHVFIHPLLGQAHCASSSFFLSSAVVVVAHRRNLVGDEMWKAFLSLHERTVSLTSLMSNIQAPLLASLCLDGESYN